MAWLLLAACCSAWPGSAQAVPSGNVLVIYSNGRLLPANVEFDQGLMRGLSERRHVAATVFSEFLDAPVFGGEAHESTFARYLHDKYAARAPSLIIVGGAEALVFMTRHREQVFPGTPVLHVAVAEDALRTLGPLPREFSGVPLRHDIAGTIEQALRWHPKARHLLVVLGSGEHSRDWEQRIQAQVGGFEGRLGVEFLKVESIAALRSRLQGLGDDWLVFTPGFFADGQGQRYLPRDAAALVASASPVAVYGPFSTFIGTGSLGGRMASYAQMGGIAAQYGADLLAGAPAASLVLPEFVPMQMHVDWRQARRWGLTEADLPPDSVVSFRAPTFWQQYRELALAGIAVMGVQAALIGALLLERRRRRRTAAALSASEQGMKLAAHAARLSMWALDAGAADAKPVLPARRSTDQAMQHFSDFGSVLADVHPADRAAVEAAVAMARGGDGQLDVEFRRVGSDGKPRWLAARGRSEPGAAPRMLGVAMDITERKQAEMQAAQDRAALRHMTRVSVLGQLSASIAHQLNQPLASILSNAEAARMMLDRTPLDLAELRSICDDIVDADQRAADVIRQLGALFKRSDAALVSLDLNGLVLDTLALVRGDMLSRHVPMHTQLAPGLPAVRGDRVQLQQLLLNLVVNAADAMQPIAEGERQLLVSTELRAGKAALCVADRGPGIPASDLPHVFEPFWSGKDSGMGMGLAICRSIADAHRGELTVGHGAHGGAVFCLQLPLEATP